MFLEFIGNLKFLYLHASPNIYYYFKYNMRLKDKRKFIIMANQIEVLWNSSLFSRSKLTFLYCFCMIIIISHFNCGRLSSTF